MKSKLIALMFIAAFSASCAKMQPVQVPPAAGIVVEIEEPVVFRASSDGVPRAVPYTKSSVCQEDTLCIRNLTVWSYGSDGNLANTCFLEEGSLSNISHARILGDGASSDSFTVLLLANMGDMSTAAPARLSEAENSTFDLSSFAGSGCFPLSGIHRGVDTGTLNLKVGRMVSRYDFSFRQSEGNRNEYTVTSLGIKNMNGRIRPFKPDYRGTVAVDGVSDNFSESDIAEVNAGKRASVYVFENCQGDINSEVITSADLKVESNLDGDRRGLCTYFEMTCDVVEKKEENGCLYSRYLPDVKYRWYFGHGENMYTCNFDVPRNYIYDLTVSFDSFTVEGREWRVVPDHAYVLVPDFQNLLMRNGMVRMTADLYCDDVCVERDFPCRWSVSSGSGSVSVGDGALEGYLCGKNEGQAVVQCIGKYDGKEICSGKGVSVLNGRWFCQYAFGSGFRKDGYGSIDFTKYSLKINTVAGFRLLCVNGLIRYEDSPDSEDLWFEVTAPAADWSHPQYSRLPESLIYSDECPTRDVDFRFLPGQAAYPACQMLHIYYVDTSNRIYDEYVTWEELSKFNDSSGLFD